MDVNLLGQSGSLRRKPSNERTNAGTQLSGENRYYRRLVLVLSSDRAELGQVLGFLGGGIAATRRVTEEFAKLTRPVVTRGLPQSYPRV